MAGVRVFTTKEKPIEHSGSQDCDTVKLPLDGCSGDVELEREFAMRVFAMFELFKRKQASYGPRNISTFGERGVLIRSNDKIQRLIRMVWQEHDNPLRDESIEDTWYDLSVYAIIALLCRDGKWPQ